LQDESTPRGLYSFFTRNWLLTASILTLPAAYFVLIQVAGRSVRLVRPDGTLSLLAVVLFWVLFAVDVAFSFVKALADRYNEKVKYHGQYILRKLFSCVNVVKERKARRFLDYIDEHHGKTGLSPFHDITKPRTQIESILENVRNALSDLFGIAEENIGLSIIHAYPVAP